MSKITDSEIRELFFEFTNEQINGIRYLTQEAFKQALNKALTTHDSDCPNLTNLWNEAVIKQENGDHNVFSTNDCWGALRTLEKHGLCKINKY
tara:strand:- start:2467 stop:2745 length:279 start_codon:yes stop_codon:yes gene_type:complete